MGRPKSFLPYAGKTLIEHSLDLMQEVFSEVILVTDCPENYEHLSAHIVRDIIPNRGPLVAILSGLLVTTNEHSLVMPCDMPFVNKKLMLDICEKRHESDLVVYAHEDKIEPLLGIYSRNCIHPLEEALFQGRDLALDFILHGNHQTFDYVSRGYEQLPHFNVDTPVDYAMLCGAALPGSFAGSPAPQLCLT
jgi:molybdopterin-guanine dinucleotide biosynthesis protein A